MHALSYAEEVSIGYEDAVDFCLLTTIHHTSVPQSTIQDISVGWGK